jgi:hypothetical protein
MPLAGLAGSRDRIEARSKRKPSTRISLTQYRRLSRIIHRTIGSLAFNVLPQPM